MIQRIQSIWLLLAAAAAFLTLRFSFYSGNMLNVETNTKAYHLLTAQSNILLTILTAGAGLAALISIFLYKNRKQQFRIVMLTLLVSVINIVLFFLESRKYVAGEGNYDLTAALAFAVPVFLILALRGIRKDEKLVKSLDRLR
jgi:glucan phosphoethanolaminetransferase (alkaline phosphatase superfamily)